MSRYARRTLFKGAAGAAGLAAISRLPGAQLIRAQGAAYEIVSFGPVAEGVMGEGLFRPQHGSIAGIHANGTAYGKLAASAEKFTPALFNADGSVTKLKSGTFGGHVTGMNDAGVAVGGAYENPGGTITDEDDGVRPAAWIDGDLVRLELPGDKKYDFSRAGGSARSISEDGVILGTANGYDVLWVDGAVQILPAQADSGQSISYSAITPGGTLVATLAWYEDDTYRTALGSIEGTSFSPFNLSDFGDASPFVVEINSADEVLVSGTPTDLPLSNITGPGLDPIVIDDREDGVSFASSGFNASQEVTGNWRTRQDMKAEAALLRDGEIVALATLLPSDHGFENIVTMGISDDGIIAATGWDADGGFHPLLFVPA